MADERIYTIANTRIYIGNAPMPAKMEVVASDFAGLARTEIAGLYNLGNLGGEQSTNTFEPINSDWPLVSKGSRSGGTMTNQFIPLALDPGQQLVQQAIEDKCGVWPIWVERGADCAPESSVSIAIGGVVTWTGSNFSAGQPVMFTTDSGSLPSEIDADTIYYVVAGGLSADSFSVAATVGGSAITTAGASSGTIIATAPPAGMTQMFQALVMDGERLGNARNDAYLRTYNFAVNGRIIEI